MHDERQPYEVEVPSDTLRNRLHRMPPLITDGLWPPQVEAIVNLWQSLAADRLLALIQMATGSGKTFAAVNVIYRFVATPHNRLPRQTKSPLAQSYLVHNATKSLACTFRRRAACPKPVLNPRFHVVLLSSKARYRTGSGV